MNIKENNNKSINNSIEKNSLSLFIYKLIFILVLLKIILYKKVYKISQNDDIFPYYINMQRLIVVYYFVEYMNILYYIIFKKYYNNIIDLQKDKIKLYNWGKSYLIMKKKQLL